MAKVKNLKGTSTNKCKCGSWLRHWQNHSKQDLPKWCAEKGCINKDLVGAHVQKADLADMSWYIVPLCGEHNKSSETIELIAGIALVSANVSNTCS